jgi:hypothetical protein
MNRFSLYLEVNKNHCSAGFTALPALGIDARAVTPTALRL